MEAVVRVSVRADTACYRWYMCVGAGPIVRARASAGMDAGVSMGARMGARSRHLLSIERVLSKWEIFNKKYRGHLG